MPSTDTLTILRHTTIKLTKTWRQDGSIESYGKAKHFELVERRVDGIHALSAVLREIETDPHAAVIRGEYCGDRSSRKKIVRQKCNFLDAPRHYLMLDFDGYKTRRNWRADPAGTVRECIENSLPAMFHGVSVHWQLSASAGHPSKGDGLRVHVWIWSNIPYTSAQLRKWADAVELPCDHSLFDSVQLHYVAAPVFEEGVADPIKCRSGLLEGEFGNEVLLILPGHDRNTSADDWALTASNEVPDTPESQNLIVSALAKISPDCDYEQWRNIVFAVLSTGASWAEEIARKWSQCAPSRYDADAFATLVGSHKANRPNRITIGTLFKLATDNGWRDPRMKALAEGVELLRADQIKPEAINWLWHGWLAAGKLILKAGSPGTGKTTLAMAMAGIVTSGGRWPDGSACERGDAVIWSGEDDPADTLVPRLLASNADLKRVHFVGAAIDMDGRRSFDPARDMPLLQERVQKIDGVRLIVVDPIVSAVAGDSHKNAEVRRGLQPLVDLASSVGACLLGVTHFTKGTNGRDTTERVTGSLAFAALSRIVLATAKDVGSGDYLLTRSKSNIGPDGGGFRYRLEQTQIPDHIGITASRVVWGERLEGNARQLISEAEGEQQQGGKEGPAEVWLHSALELGPVKASDLFSRGEAKGFGERRLQRALVKIGGIKEKTGFQGQTWWLMPGDAVPSDEGGEGL